MRSCHGSQLLLVSGWVKPQWGEEAGEEKLSVSSDPVRTGPWQRRIHEGTLAAAAVATTVPALQCVTSLERTNQEHTLMNDE
jgi:hypothetical protein